MLPAQAASFRAPSGHPQRPTSGWFRLSTTNRPMALGRRRLCVWERPQNPCRSTARGVSRLGGLLFDGDDVDRIDRVGDFVLVDHDDDLQ